jgi:hypothetical protein
MVFRGFIKFIIANKGRYNVYNNEHCSLIRKDSAMVGVPHVEETLRIAFKKVRFKNALRVIV